MSLRPGIGSGVTDDLAHLFLSLPDHEERVDVPTLLTHGRRQWPLGSYLTKQLRRKVGRDEKTPPEKLEEYQKKLQVMRNFAEANAPRGHKTFYFKNAIIDAHEGARINQLARARRNRKKGGL